ncbi:MAG TPA: D-alanine--D-alanine ligase [Patescibacteria group bacterium]|nr:D-alanine--D-alanine ligase [Patescibacteria group bacterium]
MKRVAIITGGTSSEREISLRSAKNVQCLLEQNFNVDVFDFPNDRERFLLQRNEFAVAVPVIHGRGGEDGAIQGLLRTMNIPYLFSDVEAHAIAIDKAKAKLMASFVDIRVPGSIVLNKIISCMYRHPVFVKPVDGGSSVASRPAHSQIEFDTAIQEARKFSDQILVEDYIEGREFTVGVVESSGRTNPLPVILIKSKTDFFDFESKYNASRLAEEICPAPISLELTAQLQSIALKAHETIGCRHVSRTDIIVDKEGTPWFLEINTIPGMTETSLLPKALMASGLDFSALLKEWVDQTTFQD